MPSWKKVLVSGSNAHLNHVTSSGNFSASLNSTGSFGDIIVGATENSQFYSDFSSSIQSRVAASEAGGVTGVTAGTGISGGGTSGTVTVNVDFSDSTFNTNVSGSWRGELSSSAMTDVGGGVTGSSTSTGSFGHLKLGNVDTDASFEFGRAHIGHIGYSDMAGFSHVDNDATSDFALAQSAAGKTIINAKSGQPIAFKINNSDKVQINSSGDLGIGIETALHKLHVVGNGFFTGDVSGSLASTVTFGNYGGNISGSSTSTGSFGRVELTTIGAFKAEGAIDFNNENMTNVDIDSGTITGITDLAVADGGTGASTFTDGGVLLGSGTDAITAMAALGDGEMIVGDGSTDPVAESGATLRTSIGVGTTDDVMFANITGSNDISASGDLSATGNLDIDGTSNLEGDVTLQNNLAVTGNITGSNISASSNLFGTLQTAAQTNITSVGALDAGSITSNFGTINNGGSAITTTGLISGGSLDIDDVLINGTTIGHTDDTDLLTVADGELTLDGKLTATGNVSSSLASTGSFGRLVTTGYGNVIGGQQAVPNLIIKNNYGNIDTSFGGGDTYQLSLYGNGGNSGNFEVKYGIGTTYNHWMKIMGNGGNDGTLDIYAGSDSNGLGKVSIMRTGVSASLSSTGSFGRVELTTIGAFKAEGAIDFNNENMTNVDIDSGTITGITDLAVADGGTGASTLTDGGILLGSGTDAITAMSVLGDGEMIVGDGSTDPVAESGATLRTSIGVGTTDTPTFAGLNTTGDIVVEGSLTANSYIVSSSVTHLTSSFSSGSTIFGNDTVDNHEFTGSVNISGSVTLGDNTTLGIGDADDLQLYHDGSNSYIKDNGTGNIFYRGGTQTFQNAAGSKTMVVLNAANSVDLNYNNATKFQTTGDGISVTGELRSSAGATITGSIYISGSLGGNDGAVSASGDIVADGDIIAYNASDRELKDNLQVIQGSLDKIGEINGYEFDWNDKSPGWARERGHDVGVVAQEVQKILPEVVTKRKNGYLGVDYKRIVPLLIESIKELKQEVEELKKKVN